MDFRLGRQLGKPPIAHKDRSKRSANGTETEVGPADPVPSDTGLAPPPRPEAQSDDGVVCDEATETCAKAFVNPGGNRVRNRQKITHEASRGVHSWNGKRSKVKRETREKRHVRITEEEDFDVRLCQANRNGTICPEGIDQVPML